MPALFSGTPASALLSSTTVASDVLTEPAQHSPTAVASDVLPEVVDVAPSHATHAEDSSVLAGVAVTELTASAVEEEEEEEEAGVASSDHGSVGVEADVPSVAVDGTVAAQLSDASCGTELHAATQALNDPADPPCGMSPMQNRS